MKAAIILGGCGAKDGSEIQETVFSLCALQEHDFVVQAFAINSDQHELINHLSGAKQEGKRNMLIEAARIVRGNILPIDNLKVEDYAVLVIPGGFGAAKNLCDYAFKGTSMQVRPEISHVIEAFYAAKKPIGAICIAPMIVGKVLGKEKIKVTLGHDKKAGHDVEVFGAVAVPCGKEGVVVDAEHRIVTTPAYMHGDATLPEVFSGIRKMVSALKELC